MTDASFIPGGRARRAACVLLFSTAAAQAPAEDAAGPGPSAARPAAIEVDGVPEIPAATAARLRRYQEIRPTAFVDWTAGGGMLVARRPENLYQLHTVAAPGAPPRQVTSGSEPVDFGRCLPGGEMLFSRGRGGDENYQVYRLDPATGAEVLLTDGASRNLLGEVHPDGQRVALTSTRRNGRDADVYLAAAGSPSSLDLLLEVKEETWHVADFSPSGDAAVLVRTISRNESYAVLVDLASRARTPIPAELPALGDVEAAQGVSRDNFRFGPGKSLYFLSDARSEILELVRLDLATRRVSWLSADLPYDVEDLAISRDRETAAFTVNAGGYSRLFLADDLHIPSPTRREVDLATAIAGGLKFSPDGKRLGLTLGAPTAPSEACALVLETGKLERWTSSDRAGFTDADFVRPELIHAASFDGRKIPAFVYPAARPAGSTATVPVVVTIHGGPEGQHRPAFSASVQQLVRELGACVIAPNVRGSTGYGKTYTLLDNGRKREDSVRDIGAILDWVAGEGRERFGLDPERVAVTGGSYGGYMVLASLVHFPGRIRAGVDVVGISDFTTFLENTSAYRRDLRRVEYGDERDPEMRHFFAEISPLARAGTLRSALFVIHGQNDPRVPFSEAVQLAAKARAAGNPVWTLFAANEGHGFQRRENRDYEEAARFVFLTRFLTGPAAPAESHHERANRLFNERRFAEAVLAYDASIAAAGSPHNDDSCWERGLARYYAGDYAGAKRQFEGYHKVGPLDIENGLWRLLSAAEVEGLEAARAALYPYPRKVRPPFPALHALYRGAGTIDAVVAEAREHAASAEALRENLFYAHYYTAKHLEAEKRSKEAIEHLETALKHEVGHFMYACAKIDLERLKAARAK